MRGSPVEPHPTARWQILDAFDRALRLEAHNIAAVPHHTWQECYNELQWDDPARDFLAPQFARRTSNATAPWLHKRTRMGRGGELLQVLAGHSGPVLACAVSPDGSYIASGSRDRTVRIWDSETGRARLTLEGHEGDVTGCAIGPGGDYVVSASWDGTLRIWDPMTGAELQRLGGRGSPVLCCAVAPDGSFVVSGSVNGTASIWDPRGGRELQRLEGHKAQVECCAVAPDGSLIVSGQRQRSGAWDWERTPLRLWDSSTGRPLRALKGHRASVTGCAVSPDGSLVVSASEDGTVRIWDTRKGRQRRVIKWPGRKLQRGVSSLVRMATSCAVGPDGSFLVAGNIDGTLRLWDPADGRELRALAGHAGRVEACAVSPDGGFVVSASADATLMTWALDAPEEIRPRTGHREAVRTCAVAPDGSFVLSASDDTTVRIRDPETAEELRTLTGHSQEVDACAVSPNRSFVVSGARDGTLRIWDPRNGRELDRPTDRGAWEEEEGAIPGCAVSPDGSFVACVFKAGGIGHREYSLNLWDSVSGRLQQAPSAPRPTEELVELYGCTVGPDGPRLVVHVANGSLAILNPATGSKVSIPPGAFQACAVAPDGTSVVSASREDRLKVWDAATGEEIQALGFQRNQTCAVSPDGSLIAAGSGRQVSLWEMRTGKYLGSTPLLAGVLCIAFHPSRPRIYCGDGKGDVLSIDLVGIEYGPVCVTAIDAGDGPMLRCPTCWQTRPLDETELGRVIVCPTESCQQELSLNTFVMKSSGAARGWRPRSRMRLLRRTALLLGGGAAAVTYRAASAWPPTLLAFLLTSYLVLHGVLVATRSKDKVRDGMRVLIPPAAISGVTYLTYDRWGSWVRAVLLGIGAGWPLGIVLWRALFRLGRFVLRRSPAQVPSEQRRRDDFRTRLNEWTVGEEPDSGRHGRRDRRRRR